MTPKLKLFCNEYLIDLNATQAAIRAGYSKKTASSIGWENLRKPDAAKYIEENLDKRAMSAAETKKLLSDIARSCINDYLIIRKTEYTPKVEKSLKEIIKDAEEEMKFEAEYAHAVGMNGDEFEEHLKMQEYRRRKLVRMRLELKRNPKTKMIVSGKPELVETTELDLAKLARDKESGRIKSYSVGANGVKIELFSAETALTNIARMHGLFEKDNDQQKNETQVVIFELPDNGR